MYYVYIIQSSDNQSFYTGFTSDLKQRINDHNTGKNQSTKKFRSWELVTYVSFSNKYKALRFEKYLKTGSGIAFANKHLR